MPRIVRLRKLVSGLALLLCASQAQADLAGFQAHWDNDSWLRGGTDRWYTNGIRLSWTRQCAAEDQGVTTGLRAAGHLLGLTDADAGNCTRRNKSPRMAYTIGQTMYTPNNITKPGPQPLDRPWAGFLYAAASAIDYDDKFARATELKLGITGPASRAEWAQKWIHRTFDAPTPAGWSNQLHTRLGVQLSHTVIRRFESLSTSWISAQASGSASLGTLRNYASVGAAVLVGRLQGHDGPVLVGNEGDFVIQDFSNRTQYQHPYAFVAVAGTAVASNWFLDGKTPYGRSQIERRRNYSMWQWGVALPLSGLGARGGSRLVYTQTARTREFDSPQLPVTNATQRWATLALVLDFE